MGRVRPPQQRRARGQLGEPRQPSAHERLRRTSARCPPPGEARRRRRALVIADVEAGFDDGRTAHRGGAVQGCARRGDAPRGACQSIRQRAGAVGASSPIAPGRDRPPCRAALHRQPQGAVHAVPAVQLADAPRAPRARGWLAGPLEIREVVEPDGSGHAVLTGDYASWVGPWGARPADAGTGAPGAEPLFAKLDPATV